MPSTINEQRLTMLRAELSALKQQRKEETIALKKSQQWVSIKKRLPENEDQRVIVWREDQMCIRDSGYPPKLVSI